MSHTFAISRRQFIRQAGIIGLTFSSLPMALDACATNTISLAPTPAPTLHWRLASKHGILVDKSASIFNAGHVNDVLELPDGTIIVGADSGGVWALTGNGTSVTPLSNTWDNPDVRCMAQGINLNHLFVACSRYVPNKISTLYERDPTKALTDAWREVALPGIGNINNMAVSLTTQRIVLACDNGVFWSAIPTTTTGPYTFTRALGNGVGSDVLTGPFYGIAIGAANTFGGPSTDTIVATSQPLSGIAANFFAGEWQGSDLVLREANLGASASERANIETTSVTVCPLNVKIAYAVSSSLADETIAVFWTSQDGGQTWSGSTPRLAPPDNRALSVVSGGQGASWNNCIAVSPLDTKLIGIGWVNAFYSSDAGATWHQNTANQDHADHHRVYFNTAGNVFLACDGGIFVGNADFTSFSSSYNQQLANLQFYAPYGLHQSWGTESVSDITSGLTGGGLQDNGNVFALMDVNGAALPWQKFDGGDGGLWLFIGTGQVVSTQVLDGNPAVYGHWDPVQQVVVNDGVVPNGSDPTGVINPITEVVIHQGYTNSKGQKMWAVGITTTTVNNQQQSQLFGLFAYDDGSKIHWEQLQSLEFPQNANYGASAIASYSGKRIIMGFIGPAISLYDSQDTTSTQGTGFGSYNGQAAIARIIPLSEQEAIATNNIFASSASLYATTDGGVTWHPVASSGLPNEIIYSLAVDYESNPPTLYATTDAQVFRSLNKGVTWVSLSDGLPSRPHCTDIHIAQLSTGPRLVMLATYGRSMYLANLNGSD